LANSGHSKLIEVENNMNKRKAIPYAIGILAGIILMFAQTCAFAAPTMIASGTTGVQPVAPVSNPCPRFKAGSIVHQPPALFSSNGVLNVQFSYQTTTDFAGRQLFCYMTPDGLEDPTLHVKPGDTLNITVTNNTPASPVEEPFNAPTCGDTAMTGSSMNIHYHGTNTTPACGGDNVVKTLINSGNTFQYSLAFPTNEPPGLYWYHPHVHGIAEAAVLGGAAGALVVDGIQNVQPAVQGLRHRILVIRDQPQLNGLGEGAGNCGVDVPFQDISVNYVPIDSHQDPLTGNVTFTPAVLHMQNGEMQFWRVTNSTSDTILDLQVNYDGVAQTLQLVGIDAVPVNSQDGTQPGTLIPVSHFRLPPAARVEFLVKAPSQSVQVAQFITQNINTGPDGDCDPTRPIFNIKLTGWPQSDFDEPVTDDNVGSYTGLNTSLQRFGGISSAPIAKTRTLFFSEVQPTEFFITVDGQTPTLFDNNNPPAIISTQGTVEKWTVRNIARENHELHLHQIHFKVLSQDNFEINGGQQAPAINGQFLDMIEVPFWDQNPKHNPPQVELLLDFRGPDIGDFVYHCHILGHEDLGMMAIIRVVPNTSKLATPKDKDAPATAEKVPTQPAANQPAIIVRGGGNLE
jgi:FtsP/CotA-like multicopper oxidase with cupredoxin domain